MIGKLTPDQEKAMKPYAEKWIKIGLQIGETDWETFDKYMSICYEKVGLKYPHRVVRVKSPLVGAFASMISEAIWRNRRCGAVDGAVDGAVAGAVDGAVDVAVGDAVAGAVDGAVDVAVGDAVDDAVDDAVEGAVAGENNLLSMLDFFIKKFGIQKKFLEWHSWLGGQFWIGGGYFGWYGVAYVNFFFDICGLKLSKDIHERAEAYRKVCESVNYIWPNRNFVMVCARPNEINRDEHGRLHNENGMSICYPDGWGLFHLHGTNMEEWMVMTPAEQIDPVKILAVKNAEQRMRLMQKVGIERMLEDLPHRVIDQHGDYALLMIDIGVGQTVPYLKMRNPSTGTIHLEGVETGIKTVKEAINWRWPSYEKFNIDWKPETIT